MGFQSGLSGLNTSSKNLDVIGNNVANASVVGFKSAQAQFADVFANSLTGAGAGQVGIGSKVANVAQQFTQGNISVTSNPLDIAVNGKGFFRMEQAGAVSYTRNGQFRFDSQGFIVNSNGQNLTGYGVDANGNILPAAPAPIQISFADVPPADHHAVRAGHELRFARDAARDRAVQPDRSDQLQLLDFGEHLRQPRQCASLHHVLRQDRHGRTVADVRHGRRHGSGQREPRVPARAIR